MIRSEKLPMASNLEQVEQHHKELKTFLEKFEEQFDVELDSTGHEMRAKENGGIHEEDHWVKGLIESPVDGLEVKVGGWFSMDTRGDGKPTIYCRLAVKFNREDVEETKAIQSRYRFNEEDKDDLEEGWGELRWESM